ncbi:MAG: oxygen-independent coproporphyrinogen-3 oxidase [Myxococcota bacterium]|jgi:oxygen-independent coproporphyrinogen-3 oxidase
MSPPFGIYVHVPWCRSRCPYCAFTVYVDRKPDYARWRAGVLADWARVSEDFEGGAHSLFFGGGTPSLADPADIATICEALPLSEGAEITLEANPGTLNAERLEAFRQAGVNRVSVGMQTLNPRFARLLSRGHTVHQAHELIELVRAAGFRSWSIDLMFALPGQSADDIALELEAVARHRPPHVSLYGLTLEPGTPLTRAIDQGRIARPDEDVWRAQYDRIVETLEVGGWRRYEVSNFCLPDHRAVHNEAIWQGGCYAGLGPSAHGFLPDGTRTRNHSTLDDWLREGLAERETPTAEQAAIDYLLTALRHTDGLDLGVLDTMGFGFPAAALTAPSRAGWLRQEGARARLVGEGWAMADGITRRLAEAMRPLSAET